VRDLTAIESIFQNEVQDTAREWPTASLAMARASSAVSGCAQTVEPSFPQSAASPEDQSDDAETES